MQVEIKMMNAFWVKRAELQDHFLHEAKEMYQEVNQLVALIKHNRKTKKSTFLF